MFLKINGYIFLGGGELGDELRKEIQSLRIKVEQLELELQNKNDEIKRLSSGNRLPEVQVSFHQIYYYFNNT